MQKAATWPLFEKRLLGGNLEEAMQGTIPLSGTYLEIARQTTEGKLQGFGPL
jgi:hypothetical protein